MLLLILASWLVPVTAHAAKRTFVPKIFGYFGSTKVQGRYESEKNDLLGVTSRRVETTLREQLNLGLLGYVYDRRFLTFRLGGAFGFQEQKIEQTDSPGSWEYGLADEYEFRAIALPEHSYNLEVFTGRSRPMIVGRHRSVDQANFSSGAILRYVKRPWNTNLRYDYDVDTGTTENIYSRYRGQLNYFKRKFIVNTNFAHTVTDLNSEAELQQTNYNALNKFTWRMLSLRSSLNHNEGKQNDFQTGLGKQTSRLAWSESLGIGLPWNFSSSLGYGTGRAKVEREFPGTAENPASTVSATTDSDAWSAGLSHQLFRSLNTNVQRSVSNSSSSQGGSSDQVSTRFGAGYNKKLYWGGFSASYFHALTNFEQSGLPPFFMERRILSAFDAPITGEPLTLQEKRIDWDTIEIYIIDPRTGERYIPTGATEPFRLRELFDYELERTADPTETVLLIYTFSLLSNPDLPPELQTDGAFELEIGYQLESGDFSMDSVADGYSLGFTTLNGRLSFAYSHSQTEQEQIGGVFPNELEKSSSDSYSVTFSRRPYRLYAMYSELNSELNPEKRWKTGGEYRRPLSEVTTVSSKAEYQLKQYLAGRNETAADAYEEELFGLHGMLQRQMARKALQLSVYGDFIWRNAQSDGIYYSLNSAMTWRLGKTEATLGASYSDSMSKFEVRNAPDPEGTSRSIDGEFTRESLSIFLDFERKLF